MIYYVSVVGSDSNDGLTPGSPFATIDHALLICSNGDTINISGIIGTNNTFIINKSVTLTSSDGGSIYKPTTGDLFLIQANNVNINNLILQSNATNTADALINIDRGSIGFNPPVNYSGIIIENCTLNMYKYGIILNGSNTIIRNNNFRRSSGSTERLSCILGYYVNGATITNNNITDTLRMQRFLYMTISGSSGSPYLNDINTKTGLVTVSGNICSCSSTIQGLQFIIQDSYIGNLSYSVHDNQLNNLGIAGKLFVSYVSTNFDLTTINNISVYNNYTSLTASGAVTIDSASSVTLPLDQKYNVYDNTSNFSLRTDYTGNQQFTQTTATIFPANLYLTTLVNYSASGGGDPHIIDIYGNKTTLPNDWYEFILYKSDTVKITARAEYIGSWVKSNKLHFIENKEIKEIDINKHLWVTRYTYITYITFERNGRFLIIDTISGFIIKDNSDFVIEKINDQLISLTHGFKYPPKKCISYDIKLDPDLINVTVDNYWDDINCIRLFPRSCMKNKIGELIKHEENNKIK